MAGDMIDTERRFQVGPATSREDVLAYQQGHPQGTVYGPDGADLSPLYCPHCDLWLGDPADTALQHVSVEHDVGHCEEASS